MEIGHGFFDHLGGGGLVQQLEQKSGRFCSCTPWTQRSRTADAAMRAESCPRFDCIMSDLSKDADGAIVCLQSGRDKEISALLRGGACRAAVQCLRLSQACLDEWKGRAERTCRSAVRRGVDHLRL
eukprot:12210572-Heterocapsa_arctica.AAC.1